MKKITLFIALLLVGQAAKAQLSCDNPTTITAGLHTVAEMTGQIPPTICTVNFQGGNLTNGAWYSYTPTQDFSVTVTTNITENSPRRDTRFHVYTGSCENLVCYSGDDDSGNSLSSVASFNVTANTRYLIVFDNKWTTSSFVFQLLENEVVVPIAPPVLFTPRSLSTILPSYYNNCVVDMNNDYLDDLVAVAPSNIRINYQNTDGTFTSADIPTATAEHEPYWSIAAGDYNKDGYNDLVYGGDRGVTFMKSNSTGTAYTKDTPGQYIFCQRTNFIDINNDGNLDAFSCHDIAPNVYYLNNGVAGFTHYQSSVTTGALGFGNRGGNYASLWFDYDNDGDSDLFISKCSGPPSELHRNNGDGSFTDISAIAGIDVTPVESWSSAVADFDNDGDMDIVIGSNGLSTRHMFFRNNLDTTNNTEEPFTNITAGSGLDLDTSKSRDYIAYDFDNDGFVDIMGSGNKIFYNNGDSTFSQVNYPGLNMGSVGDFNNDGFLDIQGVTQSQVTLFMNSGNDNKWITINLKGVTSNSNGIGARVEIYGSFGKQIRDVRSGEGFEYMSTLNTHFGIGSADAIEKVIVRWPSGVVDEITNPQVNQSLFVMETTTLSGKEFANASFSIYPNPANDVLNFKMKDKYSSLQSAEIFDMTGRLVLKSSVLNQSVAIKNLAPGSYIVLLKDSNDKQFSQKFIKK